MPLTKLLASFSLINPERSIPPFITNLTGELTFGTPADVKLAMRSAVSASWSGAISVSSFLRSTSTPPPYSSM